MARKLSRQQRKTQRKRSARAEERGLPALKLEKPSKPPPAHFESGRREPKSADHDEEAGAVSSRELPRASGLASLLDQIKRLPMSVKIASIAAVALAVVWLFSLAKKSDHSSEPAPALSAGPGASERAPEPARPVEGERPLRPPSAVEAPSAPATAAPSGSAGEKPSRPSKPKSPPKVKPAAPAGASENPY